ncbi:hypothetical protein CLV28_0403 [Sediminihabitans luteus]|uniref:Ig-like domain-containing protein n=1 Tax=Sediminihabitans luteus TaxID=1138585 RepID=A0A2M9CZ38_9CELL|nr:hypothetical protein [Sediminihabitans luteus]PJJ77189.1 hypothetical protein CLV28_0403 [Sediminihabitans luteus]GII98637.1 hypothetical protein Slu03_10150 [Sediminihabitans luteus]
MKRKILAPLAAGVVAIGLAVVPATAASAGSTGSKSFSCPNGRYAVVTASALWQVSLTVNGVTKQTTSNNGAVVSIRTGRVANYSASTVATGSVPSVSIDCRIS